MNRNAPRLWACTRAFLWRNYLMKKRRPRQTVLEVFTPIVIMLFIACLRLALPVQNTPAVPDDPSMHNSINTDAPLDIIQKLSEDPSLRILMTGSTSNSISAATVADIATHLRSRLSQQSSALVYTENEDVLMQEFSRGKVLAGIVIGPVPNGDGLRVALRMPQVTVPLTTSVFNETGQSGSYVDSMFVSLQAAIAASIVESVTGASQFPKLVTSRAFPMKASSIDLFPVIVQQVGGLYLVTGYLGFSINLLFVLVQEKENRSRETMLITGVPLLSLWISWHITYSLLSMVVTILSTVIVYTTSLIRPEAIFSFMILSSSFSCALISFSFTISTFFSKAKTASQVGSLTMMLMYLPRYLFNDSYNYLLACLSPPIAFEHGFTLLLDPKAEPFSFQILIFPLLIMIDSFALMFLAFYLDAAMPSEFRSSPIWSPCRKKRPVSPLYNDPDHVSLIPLIGGAQNHVPGSELHNENAVSMPKDNNVISIRGLSKAFACEPKGNLVRALSGLNLDIKCGKLTSILGHNGAGKTTLMSILCGLLSADEGTVYIDGDIDLLGSVHKVRETLGIGYCPQTDQIIPELTVTEHINLFARLKNVDPHTIDGLLATFNLGNIADLSGSHLSGGQKRKLSLAMSMIGNPLIVFLDEPSAGLDPVSRREMWEILEQFKSQHYLVMTTHSMDEAEMMSDMIVVLNNGQVCASGSSLELKRSFGLGYNLTVALAPNIESKNLVSFVVDSIPDASIRESQSQSEISFSLPLHQTANFAQVLSSLQRVSGVISLSLSLTSLEEVFLHLVNDKCDTDDTAISDVNPSLPKFPAGEPSFLMLRQLTALLWTFFTVSRRDFRSLIYQILLPVAGAVAFAIINHSLAYSNSATIQDPPLSFLDKSIFPTKVIPETRVFMAETLQRLGLREILITSNNMEEALLSDSVPSSTIAFAMDTSLLVYHNTSFLHSLPAAITLLTNGVSGGTHIDFVSHPFPYSVVNDSARSMMAAILLSLGFAYVPLGLGIGILRFKINGAQRLLRIMGMRPLLFWIARLLHDTLIYMASSIFCLTVIVAVSWEWTLLRDRLGSILVGFLCNAFATLSFNAFLSTKTETVQSYSTISSMVFAIGTLVVFFIAVAVLSSPTTSFSLCPLVVLPNFTLIASLLLNLEVLGPLTISLLPLCLSALTVSVFWLLLALRSDCRELKRSSKRTNESLLQIQPEDEDVAVERARIASQYETYDDMCLDNIAISLGDVDIVHGISFGIGSGDIFGLLGPNGAGKSTTMKCLIGEVLPISGRCRIDQLDLIADIDDIYKVTGYVPQMDALVDHLTGSEHLQLFARMQGMSRRDCRAYCEIAVIALGLAKIGDRMATTYSGGNKRKLSLGISLIGCRRLLLLDEPSTGLDPSSRRRLRKLITDSRQDRMTIITTHSMHEAELLCTRISIMCRGILQCIGSPHHIKSRFGDSIQIEVSIQRASYSLFTSGFRRHFSNLIEVDHYGGRIRYRLPSSDIATLPELFRYLDGQRCLKIIVDYSLSQTSLEQVFIQFANMRI
uniref:ABC transporter domain-containing protein n=1 Tax=Spongospora subterranea TaxID=70186 RepID=A0A0H5QZC2_9EUKA|eukprot:CRZ07308.1 hypothetical protein [Spongospora subterranea]